MCSVGEQNRTSRCDGIMVAAGLWLGVNVMIASVGDGGGLIEVTWRVTSAGYLPAFSLHTSALSISAAERHRRVLEPAAAWTGIADWTDGVNQTLHTRTHTHQCNFKPKIVGGRYPFSFPSLPPLPPIPSLPFSLSLPSLPSPFRSPSPALPCPPLPLEIQLGGLGERCKLPKRGLGRSPSRNRIWCILASKYDIWWQQF